MGSGGGNKGGIIGDVIDKVPPGSGKGGGGSQPPPPPNYNYGYNNYTPNYSYVSGPSYGNTQLPYSSGPYGSNYIPTPGGVSFGQKGGTMSPGFQPPGMMLGTLNYGRYPGSGIGYYNPTPEPNYNPSRPNYFNPNPVMPGPPAKGGPNIPIVGYGSSQPGHNPKGLPTPAVQPPLYVF